MDDVKPKQDTQSGQNVTKGNLVCSVPVLRNVFSACAEPGKEKSVVNVIDAAEKNSLSEPGTAAGAARNKAALDQALKGMDGP